LLRETDVNYYKGEFLKLIDLKAESKTQDAETQQKTEAKIKKDKERLAREEQIEKKTKDENQIPNSNNQPNNNPSSEKEKDKPNNSPLPSSTDIQNQYNSDKDKSEIENSSNLTNQEEQNQAQELLKIVISAELLTNKKQFNSELLTKLITEKKNNTALYQLLNKAGRIDKVISQLESIQQSQKDNNKLSQKKKDNNQIPVGIIVVVAGGIFLLLGLGIMIARRRKIRH